MRRFVILGLDGLDYRLTRKFLGEGKLPHMAALASSGCFKPLATTIPPISPVAWSSFQTGVNPGKHNVFDFLAPDRHGYHPKLSSVEIRPSHRAIGLGKYQWPLGSPTIRLLRKSAALLEDTWPAPDLFRRLAGADHVSPRKVLRGAALGDVRARPPRHPRHILFLYHARTDRDPEQTGGETHRVALEGKTVRAELVGPENPFRKDGRAMTCPFSVTIRDECSADLRVARAVHRLQRGVYSDWIHVAFRAAPGVKVHGICKFLLLESGAEFQCYVTPIHIDPERPAMPVSYPAAYSVYLSKRQGTFGTLGLAEDTWALNEGVLGDQTFIQQCLDLDREREAMFFDCLDKVKRGLCVCVFDGTDRLQHTFWRDTESGERQPGSPEHVAQSTQPGGGGGAGAPACDAPIPGPAPGPELAGPVAPAPASLFPDRVLEDLYCRMDALVGRTMAACEADGSVLMIISDHGFNSFRRGIDLNRWLEMAGYLKVKEALRGQKHLAAIDWSQTRAFAVGLAGIFLNLEGRYPQGVVKPGPQAAALAREIAGKLSALIDPENQQPAVKQVYLASDVYCGPYTEAAPDLIVGYQRGYRAAWETAIGHVTDAVFHTNHKAWSGDHCVDHSLVPGVLFCNRKIAAEAPRLMDIGPTVLEMFGVTPPAYMDGKPLAIADRPKPLQGRSQAALFPAQKRIFRRLVRPRPKRVRIAGIREIGLPNYDQASHIPYPPRRSGAGDGRRRRAGTCRRGLPPEAWRRGRPRNAPRVIVIGVDGMDPRLSLAMMNAGEMPNLDRLRKRGGFSPLRTSIPPQSPVAWASFINGAGPGSHGIFDFIHRHPEEQCAPFFSAAETLPARGFWRSASTACNCRSGRSTTSPRPPCCAARERPSGTILDERGIPSTFYDLPCDYPATESLQARPPPPLPLRHGNARHAGHLRHLPVLFRGRPRRDCRQNRWKPAANPSGPISIPPGRAAWCGDRRGRSNRKRIPGGWARSCVGSERRRARATRPRPSRHSPQFCRTRNLSAHRPGCPSPIPEGWPALGQTPALDFSRFPARKSFIPLR